MRWYYSSGDDNAKRGLVEQKVLFEMAKKGEIKPTDLVWKEDSEEGWVIASSVKGLFSEKEQPAKPARKGKPAAKAGRKPEAGPTPGPPAPSPPQKPLKKILVVLSVLAALMACGVVGTVVIEIRRRNAVPPEPVITEPPIEVVRSNRVAALSRQIDVFLQREDVARSEALWLEMKKNDDDGASTEAYRQRINALKVELVYFMKMQAGLREGKVTTKLTSELVRVYEKRGGNKALAAFADGVLADKKALTPAVTLSLARLFNTLQDRDRLTKSLAAFSAVAPTNGPPTAHLEVVNMYCVESLPTNGMQLLEKYLAGEKTNSAAWYELGAIRCATGHEDEAMDALKLAVKFGNDDTKRAAVADKRFAKIQDKWGFKRLTKIKD